MNYIYSHVTLKDWFTWHSQSSAGAQAQFRAILRLLVGQAVCTLQHYWKCMAESSAGIINMSARATTPKPGPAVSTADLRAVLKSKSHYSLACQLVAPHALTMTNQTPAFFLQLDFSQFPPFSQIQVYPSPPSLHPSQPLSLNTTGTCFQ